MSPPSQTPTIIVGFALICIEGLRRSEQNHLRHPARQRRNLAMPLSHALMDNAQYKSIRLPSWVVVSYDVPGREERN
jgi:hypothetical protein